VILLQNVVQILNRPMTAAPLRDAQDAEGTGSVGGGNLRTQNPFIDRVLGFTA